MRSARNFSLSHLIFQLRKPSAQHVIQRPVNTNTRFFDDLPTEFNCIFADAEADQGFLLERLMLIPPESIIDIDNRLPEFTRTEDIALITDWAKAVLTHAANVMLTKQNKIHPAIRTVADKNPIDLSAEDILFAFMAANAFHLVLNMTKITNDNYGETRDNPYQRVFLAFNNMINKNSDVWIKELLNAREPSLGYGEMAAIGLGMAAVFLFGGVATVASIASHNNNNSPTKPPAPGKRQ